MSWTKEQKEKIRKILEAARHGDCFCQKGVGHPLYKNHSNACLACQEIFKEINEN